MQVWLQLPHGAESESREFDLEFRSVLRAVPHLARPRVRCSRDLLFDVRNAIPIRQSRHEHDGFHADNLFALPSVDALEAPVHEDEPVMVFRHVGCESDFIQDLREAGRGKVL